MVGQNLGKHACFPDPPRNQLRVLGPEIQDEDDFTVAHRLLDNQE
jgi:hypothetical protein